MRQLTMRAIGDVVSQVAQWKSVGLTVKASINVSARDLHTHDIVDHLVRELRRTRVDARQIQVEVTETALMTDPRRGLVTLKQLADLGVSVSLDDFGTGYASLQHLRRLPLAEVKIDSSFVARMSEDPYDAAVVRSIVELARSLGLRTVAEGVEDERHQQTLRRRRMQHRPRLVLLAPNACRPADVDPKEPSAQERPIDRQRERRPPTG